MSADPRALLSDLIARAKTAGADAADAMYAEGTSLSVGKRLGKIEELDRAEGRDVGLRVFVGRKVAVVSSSALDPAGFPDLAERAVAMARVVPDDQFAELTEATGHEDDSLDLDDGTEPEAPELLERASAAEDAALAVAGVTNSEGGSASFSRYRVLLVTSAGFQGGYSTTNHSVSAVALAGTGVDMQRDYDFSSKRHLSELDDPAEIGHRAGERAVARLNPGRPATAKIPVVFDPRVAGSLLGHLSGAINGSSVARGTSFLKDALHTRIFAPGIEVIDDPRRVRGPSSRPFDGEGVVTRTRALVEDGVLTGWLLDGRSARQLGLRTLGNASRSAGGQPNPSSSNLYLKPGTMTPAELMADIKLGLYVTELIGMGVNGLTGDYSRGAAGFMIRDGAIAEPVAEITIAGHLRDIFAHMVPANDLRFRRGTDAPTVRIEGLTMAGA